VDLGLAEHADLVLANRGAVRVGEVGVDGLVEDDAPAEALVDERGRHLALAEPGDLDLRTDLLVRRVEARLELLEGHLDGEADPRGGQGLDGALHCALVLLSRSGCWLYVSRMAS